LPVPTIFLQIHYFYLVRPLLISLLLLLNGCSIVEVVQSTKSTTVNLSRHHLSEFPEELRGRSDIKVLRLYHNKIDSIPDWIMELSSLEKLYLSRNDISYISPEIRQLKNLKILYLAYNELDSLPEEIGDLSNLEQLYLNNNHLVYLPDAISRLESLKSLNLSYNQLRAVPAELGEVHTLESLDLSRNFLDSIPPEFGALTSLKYLDISFAGTMVLIPESMCKLRRLENLIIDQTTRVPNCLLIQRTSRLQLTVR